MKTCIACGMPLRQKEDYPLGDESKNYCKYCANEDGSMQTYEEKLESMSNFIIRTQGISEEIARIAAVEHLAKLPAWKNKN